MIIENIPAPVIQMPVIYGKIDLPLPELKRKDICCKICKLKIEPKDLSYHHLIPRQFKGKKTEPMHQECHNEIHRLFTNQELLDKYRSISALCGHHLIIHFINRRRQMFQNKVTFG